MRWSWIAVVLAGCFGTGPAPEPPSSATILLALDFVPVHSEDCKVASFIGNVALGTDTGYAVTLAFVPQCNNNPGSSGLVSKVFEFPLRGGTVKELGEAGTVDSMNGNKPRIAASGDEAVWMFQPEATTSFELDSRSGTVGATIGVTGGANAVAGLVLDDTRTFAGTWSIGGGPYHPNDPRFPCCGPANTTPPSNQFVALVNAPSATPSDLPPQDFKCEQLKDCLIGNTDTLYFVAHGTGFGTIGRQPKDGSAGETIATLDGPPTGFAVDDTRVAWSTSHDFTQFGQSTPPVPHCEIVVSGLTAPAVKRTLLSTSAFSCLDVALDGDALYFTIVDLVADSSDNVVVNRGLGRIAIDSGALETLALGIDGPEAGPRQVFVDGDGLIVIAPLLVARYPKSALDGRLDIEP